MKMLQYDQTARSGCVPIYENILQYGFRATNGGGPVYEHAFQGIRYGAGMPAYNQVPNSGAVPCPTAAVARTQTNHVIRLEPHHGLTLPPTCPEIQRSDLLDVHDKFNKITFLGGGVFGSVRLMRFASTGELCAVKEPVDTIPIEHTKITVQTEVNTFHLLHGLACIPKLFGISQTASGVPLLVQEFVGDDKTYLATTLGKAIDTGVLDGPKGVRVAREVALSLRELHHRNVIHCDLKIDNIMLEPGFMWQESPKVKIIDFGKAYRTDCLPRYEAIPTNDHASILQKCCHLDPEVVRGVKPYSLQTEIYALGLVFKSINVGIVGLLRHLGLECMREDYSLRPSLDDVIGEIDCFLLALDINKHKFHEMYTKFVL